MPKIINPHTNILETREDVDTLKKQNIDYSPETSSLTDDEIARKYEQKKREKKAREDIYKNLSKNKKKKRDNYLSYLKPVPIDNFSDAFNFLRKEWTKIHRDNGHTCTVKVAGYNEFRIGTWCAVYTAQMGVLADMYITSVDHSKSSSSEWITMLTLTDFPPSFSEDDTYDKVKKLMQQQQHKKIEESKNKTDPSNNSEAEYVGPTQQE